MSTGVYHGSLTLGAALPLALEGQVAGEAGIAPPLADLEANLDAALDAQLQLTVDPPTAGATAAAAALLAADVTPPNVAFQLTVTADLIAELQAKIALLNGYLNILAELGLSLGGAGVHLYSGTGRADEIGPTVRSLTIGGLPDTSPADEASWILLAATAPSGRAALAGLTGLQLGG